MKATTICSALFALTMTTMLTVASASAQSPTSGGGWRPAQGATLVQHHASTWAEGFLRGRADLVRAAGQYNYNTAASMIAAEEARSRSIDNHLKSVQTFYEKRRLYREEKKATARPKPSRQQLERLAKSRLPKRLDAMAYNRAAGALNWPDVLRDGAFAPERDAIDQLVRERGKSSGHDTQLKLIVAQMKDVLKANIRAMSPAEYIQAKSFLSSLQYEAKFAAASGSVASR